MKSILTWYVLFKEKRLLALRGFAASLVDLSVFCSRQFFFGDIERRAAGSSMERQCQISRWEWIQETRIFSSPPPKTTDGAQKVMGAFASFFGHRFVLKEKWSQPSQVVRWCHRWGRPPKKTWTWNWPTVLSPCLHGEFLTENLGNTTLNRERHVPEPFLFKGKTLKDMVKWQWKLGGDCSSEFILAKKRGFLVTNRSRLSIWSLEIPSFGQKRTSNINLVDERCNYT